MNKTISILIYAVMLLCSVSLNAQQICSVQGVVNSQDGVVLQYADVFLMHPQKDSIITYTQSSETGKFVMNIPAGTFRLGVNYIGYKTYYTNIDSKGKDIDLGIITLNSDTYQLQTVVVKGEAMNIKNTTDGFIVNVENLRKTSNNSLDLLKRLPMVSVKNDELKIIGKESVVVKICLCRSHLLQTLTQADQKSIPPMNMNIAA